MYFFLLTRDTNRNSDCNTISLLLRCSFHASRFGPGTGDGDEAEADGGARLGVVGVLGIWSAADRMKSSSGKASSVALDL